MEVNLPGRGRPTLAARLQRAQAFEAPRAIERIRSEDAELLERLGK
jgi:hypothetical protein